MYEHFKRVNCYLQPLTALCVLIILLFANFPVCFLLYSGKLTGTSSFVITMSVAFVILLLAIMVLFSGIFCTVFAVNCYKTALVAEVELKNTYIYILDYLNSFILLFAGIFVLIAIRIGTYCATFSHYILFSVEDFIPMIIYYPILLLGAGVSFWLGLKTKKSDKGTF